MATLRSAIITAMQGDLDAKSELVISRVRGKRPQEPVPRIRRNLHTIRSELKRRANKFKTAIAEARFAPQNAKKKEETKPEVKEVKPAEPTGFEPSSLCALATGSLVCVDRAAALAGGLENLTLIYQQIVRADLGKFGAALNLLNALKQPHKSLHG